MKMRLFSRWKN